MVEGNLLYSMLNKLNVKLIQDTFTEIAKIMFEYPFWKHGPVKLMHKN
jgi:hypothetical protein